MKLAVTPCAAVMSASHEPGPSRWLLTASYGEKCVFTCTAYPRSTKTSPAFLFSGLSPL